MANPDGTFDLRFVFGLSNVIEAVQKQKPSLLLFDISSCQKPMEKLFLELMELKSYGDRPRLWRG
jgi:hypothetical protein